MYNLTLSSTSAIDGLGGQRHASAALPLGKIRYPLCRRLGGPQDRSGRVRKISLPTGIKLLIFISYISIWVNSVIQMIGCGLRGHSPS